MAESRTVSLILGSGFSKPAGLADASEINELFQNLNNDNFYVSISYGQVYFNSSINFQNYLESNQDLRNKFLLSFLIKNYLSKHSSFDYEDFYDYLTNLYTNNEEAIEQLSQSNILFALIHNTNENGYFFDDVESNYKNYLKEIDIIFNLLIYDILNPSKVDVNNLEKYLTMVNIIKKHSVSTINIFSLNHDLLIEELFSKQNVVYCDGFKRNNVFSSLFDKNLKYLKLHGSLNWFNYQNIPSGNQQGNKYKDGDYIKSAINDQFRNTNNGNWIPKFLTGKKKEETIGIFKKLREIFKENIGKCEEIIIIGYSFRDEYINIILQSEIEKSLTIKRIININPKEEFPYSFKNCVVYNYKEKDWLEKFHLILNC